MVDTKLEKIHEIITGIETLKLCGPSDDPELQDIITYSLRHFAKNLVSRVRRIDDAILKEEIAAINTDIENIYDAYDLHADLLVFVDVFREREQEGFRWATQAGSFVHEDIIDKIRNAAPAQLDLSKVVRYCEELNSTYGSGNYLSAALLLRALLNHVPPAFGATSFAHVASQAPGSIRGLLGPLEKVARDIGDLHTHDMLSRRAILPTRNALEPFKPAVEVLLSYLLRQL